MTFVDDRNCFLLAINYEILLIDKVIKYRSAGEDDGRAIVVGNPLFDFFDTQAGDDGCDDVIGATGLWVLTLGLRSMISVHVEKKMFLFCSFFVFL